MLSLAAVSLAAPARRTGHTLAAYTTDSDLQLEELEGLGKGYGKLKVSSVCAPSDSQFWLLGTHHKTGTELMDKILTVAMGWRGHGERGRRNDQLRLHCAEKDHHETSWHDPGLADAADDNIRLDEECLNATGGKVNGNALRVRPLQTTPGSWKHQVERFASSATSTSHSLALRAVLMVRDPLDIVLSGFFYDASGGEPNPMRIPLGSDPRGAAGGVRQRGAARAVHGPSRLRRVDHLVDADAAAAAAQDRRGGAGGARALRAREPRAVGRGADGHARRGATRRPERRDGGL